MKVKQYDKVLLKDGDFAYIIEIFGDGKDLLADINRKDGIETDWIKPDDIKEILE